MYPGSSPTTGTPAVSPPNVGPNAPGADAAAAAAFGRGPDPNAKPADPYSDDKALLKCFKDDAKRCNDRRSVMERTWWRLLLYLIGRQWIYYERQAGAWLDKRLQKWIPRPVTNKIAETHNTIMSVFESVELSVSCRAQGSRPQDIMAADTANRYEAPIRDDHDMDSVEDESDFWLCALGNVGWFVWWDYAGDGPIAFIQWEQCAACGKVAPPTQVQQAGNVCPSCGAMSMQPAVNPDTQQPIGTDTSRGHGHTDVVSPLEYSFPPTFKNPNDSDVIIRWRFRTKDYYKGRIPDEQFQKIRWEQMAQNRSLQMLRSLSTTTELAGAPSFGGGGEPLESEGVTEAEVWKKPCNDYPNGLVLRVISASTDGDGIVIRLPNEGVPGPLPFQTKEGKRLWPWLFTGYEKFGGRGWSRSPLEHLIEKQNQLNQLDSLMLLTAQRMANPVWLEPKTAEVTKVTGEPGLVIKYNALASGNAKPERIEGANIPGSLPAMREQILADIEQLSGTYDIIKGQKPAGVEAFSAMQLLVERSQSRYSKVLKARGITYRKWYRIALELERALGPDERAYSILGPNGGYSFMEFKKLQLDGAIRIEVEDGSQMPKTSLGTRAAIQQLQTLQVIDTHNPDTQYSILQKFGQTSLQPGLDAQVMAARRLEQQFEAWASTATFAPGPPQPVMGPAGAFVMGLDGQPATQPGPPQPMTPPPGIQPQAWEEPAVFLAEFKKWACGDIVQALLAQRPEIGAYVTQMIVSREMILAQQQAQAAVAGAPQGGPPKPNGKDGNGVGGGRAMHNSAQESGKPGVHTGPANAA